MTSLQYRPRVRWAIVPTLVALAWGCGPAPAVHDAGDPGDGAAPHDGTDHSEGHDHPDPGPGSPPEGPKPPPSAAKAEELAAFERAKPVFEKHCARCHKPGEPGAKPATLEHLDMASYPFGGHHAAEITAKIRAALGVGGKASMPKDRPGAVTGDELALVLAWADAADRAAGAPGADAHDHDHAEPHPH